MQCYTRAHRYPKTTLLSDFPEPPANVYKKRHFFVPEPTRIGRPWCPGGVVMPPPLQHIKRVQFNPIKELHREEHMKEMLDFTNETNWTGGQDMVNFGARKTKFSDSNKFSVQSTQRAHYPGHWTGFEPRTIPPIHVSIGATPSTYHVTPYIPPHCHPFGTKRASPGESLTEDKQERSVPLAVSDNMMGHCYPGPRVQEPQRNKVQQRETVARMGLVP